MVKKIAKSLAKDFDTFMVKSDAICKKNPLKVRFMSKMRGAEDELVLKITDDVQVSIHYLVIYLLIYSL